MNWPSSSSLGRSNNGSSHNNCGVSLLPAPETTETAIQVHRPEDLPQPEASCFGDSRDGYPTFNCDLLSLADVRPLMPLYPIVTGFGCDRRHTDGAIGVMRIPLVNIRNL
ncbi:hypothetical protein [Trichothermofontia sp.]